MLDGTPLLRLYARRRLARLARLEPVAAQEAGLRTLVRRAASTRFGRDHGFAGIRTVADFQARVPLRRYEDFWRDYWQPAFPRLVDCTWPGEIPYFAVTSGTTTGITKHIPVSAAMNRANTRAGLDLLSHHVAMRPESRVLGGKGLMLGGSTDLADLAPGVKGGDLSGIATTRIPWWARHLSFPPLDVALLSDWEQKVARIAALVPRADIRIISGTPSWLLILFDRLAALHPDKPPRATSFFPNLELLIHGGVNFHPYHDRFLAYLEGSHAELREVYPASEGFIAVADRGFGDGLRLLLDNGLFFEFVPADELGAPNPTRRWIADVERDVNYALLLTSCAGVWAYVLGDTVRFVDLDPPRVLVTGRTSWSLSAFGEHLIGEEIEAAVAAAAHGIGADVTDYAVGAVYPDAPGALGGHLFIVEFAATIGDPARLAAFAEALDARLAIENDDYRAHRAEGFGMLAPRVHTVPSGTFAAWMKRRGKLGGQHKVPRIVNDQALFADLRAFTGSP